MISTDITRATSDRLCDRTSDRARGTSADRGNLRTVATVACRYAQQPAMADLRVLPFTGGHVWVRPAALGTTVTTVPGHLAWSPPT